jgi:hypothetical protein
MSNTMKGRHGVGGQTARPGNIRGGQGAHVANGVGTGHNQQTASRPAMRPQAPVLSNQAETSRTAQRMIPRPPMPFENPMGPVNLPAPAHSQFRSDGNAKESQKRYGGASSASIHSGTSLSRDEMAAIGYGPKDTQSSNPIISGYPGGMKRQSGMPRTNSKRASGRDNARVRQRPGGF